MKCPKCGNVDKFLIQPHYLSPVGDRVVCKKCNRERFVDEWDQK